ncbi:hypothetical protein [Burkholderia lata]|uniref:hypothetical protein n=1 Tax=Burkholderia lata (strain ATCC 17760 / DSM 23089 / LMG 22485 / NCIMB 9086 / R18194 / 383) TaxID=482957 RepID=UPI0015837622|nr:hypothetical protein [Burkholderia lata]
METQKELADDFSGVVQEQIICTTVADNSTRVISTTTKHYQRGFLHREDGPAVERSDGSKEWWIGGNPILEGELPRAIKRFLNKQDKAENQPK